MLLHTASTSGKVHLMRDGSSRTLCGRRPRFSPTANWPRWTTDQASLDVRQRPACETCVTEARKLKLS
jgi:hypothetical protein